MLGATNTYEVGDVFRATVTELRTLPGLPVQTLEHAVFFKQTKSDSDSAVIDVRGDGDGLSEFLTRLDLTAVKALRDWIDRFLSTQTR